MDNENENNKGPIECRAAVAITALDKNEIVFLPAGVHEITPVSGGIGRPIKVFIDPTLRLRLSSNAPPSPLAPERKFTLILTMRTGRHRSGRTGSFTNTGEGVVAQGEWSASGKKAVEGKDYRAFSPVFHVDDKRADPAKVVCYDGARVNMGGLVNDPAFNNLPMWAKNDGSPVAPLEQPAKINNNTRGESHYDT